MYWVFADSQQLIEVLTSQIVPAEIAGSAARFGESATGELWIESSVSVSRSAARQLRAQGISSRRRKTPLNWRSVAAWWQMIPPNRMAGDGIDRQQPLILAVPAGEELDRTLREILRLGGRLLGMHPADAPDGRAFLQVEDLPYFTLTGALNAHPTAGPSVFVPRTPQVAIEAGFSHPLAEVIPVPDGALLLLDGAGERTFVKRSRFRTLTEQSSLSISGLDAEAFARKPIDSIPVKLRLVSQAASEPPGFWVVPMDELRAWVQEAEQRLLEQLALAVMGPGESPGVLVKPLKEDAPPVLLWESGFCPSRQVPGLYVPGGRELHPSARPDVLQAVLGCHRDALTWITADAPNTFRVQSVPRSAFRPLIDWVEYDLPHPLEQYLPWSPEFPREMEPFQILEEPNQRSTKEKRKPAFTEEPNYRDQQSARTNKTRGFRKSAPAAAPRSRPSQSAALDHREARRRLAVLEKTLRTSELPLDAEAHRSDWREMAGLHFTLRQMEEGLLCLSHALWNGHAPDAGCIEGLWNQSAVERRAESPMEELEHLLRSPKPTADELSRLVLLLIGFSVSEASAENLRNPTAAVQEFLIRNEHELPVRAAWLAWVSLLKTIGGDPLALARARDRFLERLFARGIRLERDIPKFLRSGRHAGPQGGGGSLRLADFRDLLHTWSQANSRHVRNETRTYLDLVLAFGLARRGESAPAKKLLESAGNLLRRTKDKLHLWCLAAFEHRIRQALAGEDSSTPLPAELAAAFEKFSKHEQFKLNRLRQDSQILEPPRTRDLYESYRGESQDDLAQQLAALDDIEDAVELTARFERIQQTRERAEDRCGVMLAGLRLAPRMGASIARRLLERSVEAAAAEEEPLQRMRLLEKSLGVAAHFDWPEWVARFVQDLSGFLDSLREATPETVLSLETLASESFQGLRRFGLRAEMLRLLDQLEHLATAHQTPPSADRTKRLLLSLQIAGGRLFFEQAPQAWPLVDRVRDALQAGDLSALAQTQVARAYLRTVGLAPAGWAGERFWDFFQNIHGITDAFSLNSHVSISQLSVAEALIFAITGEINQSDPATRRLLDDEEFCVRRRIHHDLQHALNLAQSPG